MPDQFDGEENFTRLLFRWRVVCAWCGKLMSGNPAATEVSHGICQTCYAEEMKKLTLPNQEN
jgi:NMD protein affecting ribosome stability and mRNA decay